MSELVNKLIHRGYLKTDIIIDAFSEINRAEFVPDKFRMAAMSDIPLSIGHGQILPEPSVISFMLELLRPDRGHSVLVVGFGGGWVISLLAFIVGSDGSVDAIDDLGELKEDTQRNVNKFNFITRNNTVSLNIVSGAADIDMTKKYDRIIVINPHMWSMCDFMSLLAIDGVMVAPIDNIIYYFSNRGSDEENVEERFDSMRFLPV
jgi:protein-L-isoaspartate(D-aspartate) O-methyltransferase